MGQQRPAELPPLQITNAAVMESEDGGTLRPGFQFLPGDVVFFTFRIANFRRMAEEQVRMSYRLEARDSQGVLIVEPMTGDVNAVLNLEDKEWTPRVRQFIAIPALALPGTYKIAAYVKDEIDGREAKGEYTFPVAGRKIEPSDTLTIREFRFLRTEDDAPRGIDPPVYAPGAPVFARFDITGQKFGERNKVMVEYGLEVTNAKGERIINEPKAASEQDEGFYPKKYIPAVLQLQFKPDLPPGEYTIRIFVNDTIGKQTFETRQMFRVE